MMAEVPESFEQDPHRRRWALTKDAFDRLLLALDPDTEQAGNKYLLLRRNLVRYFEGRGCPFAEDHADEVVNRVAKRLSEGEEIRDLNGYSYGVARLLLLEVFKDRERQERAFKELPALRLVESERSKEVEDSERLDCLRHCLDKLPPEGRRLILEYYQGDKQQRIANRKRLGEELRIANDSLRSRAVRLREKLEVCVSGCLIRTRPGVTN
jgi:RNA polymerase sigma factor (sigma-70 family)